MLSVNMQESNYNGFRMPTPSIHLLLTRRVLYSPTLTGNEINVNQFTDKDIMVCLPGARIEQVTERVGLQRIMGRGNGGTIILFT